MSDSDTQPSRLSVSMALSALQEASEEVRRYQALTDESRAFRDDLIRGAGDLPVRKLAKITGLSRDAIYKILSGGESR